MEMRPWEWAYYSRKWKQYKENKQALMKMNVEVKEFNLSCVFPPEMMATEKRKKEKKKH